MGSAVDTLFIPHRNGALPALDAPWLFLGADVPEGGFNADQKEHLICEQGWRASYLSLKAAGMKVETSVPDKVSGFGGAFILLTKHKRENVDMIARANRLLGHNKPILVAGDKNLGVASIRKWVGKHHTIIDALAKNHATVFWFLADAQYELMAPEAPTTMPDFKSAPGMFSPDKVDMGSAFLATFIDSGISGDVADFGAGWGYLSKALLENSKPRSLALLESHWHSLEAAKYNLAAANVPINYRWIDVVNEPITQKYDWIIMNPPFHDGKKTDPQLGEKFIEVASKALKSGGRLLMVANTTLPYETKLQSLFKTVECLQIKNGFKVLKARR